MTLSPNDPLWFSGIKAAETVDSENDIEWHYQSDVVVVGLGGAGVCAALEASENGASVIAIERFEGGGDTTLSGGVVYAGGGTRYQKEAGFEDTPEKMFAYLSQEVRDVVSTETLQTFCRESVDNLEWLEKNGVIFKASLSPVKTSYPAKKYFLYYSGNETVAAYLKEGAEKLKNTVFIAAESDSDSNFESNESNGEHASTAATKLAAPRGHRAVGKGLSGSAFYQPLHAEALSKGLEIISQARAQRLIVNKNNEVIGLELQQVVPHLRAKHRKLHEAVDRWRMYAPALTIKYRKQANLIEEQHSQTIYVRANQGVILSCGGFVMNRKMLEDQAPKYRKGLPLGTTGANGAGIRLGQTLNGATAHMSNVSAWRFINPPLSWAKGMIVNANGQRYVNEQCYGAVIGREMCEEHSGKAYLILNRSLLWRAIREALPGRIWIFQSIPAYLCMLFAMKKASTIDALAKKMRMPEDKLNATLNTYNEAAHGKQEDQHGKSLDFMQAMEKGPYYGLDVSIDSQFFPLPTITLGGLCVDEASGLVKNEQGETIPKLYAAGRNAVGIASNMYVSGLSIADCVFSGRRAGKHAAMQIKSPRKKS